MPTRDKTVSAILLEGCSKIGPVLCEFDGRGTVRTILSEGTFLIRLITSWMSTAAIIEIMKCSSWKGIIGNISLAGPGRSPKNIISDDCTKSSFELEKGKGKEGRR